MLYFQDPSLKLLIVFLLLKVLQRQQVLKTVHLLQAVLLLILVQDHLQYLFQGVLFFLMVMLFLAIKRHYRQVAKLLRLASDKKLSLPPAPADGGAPVVVLVGQLHRGSFEAVRYARSIARELVAVHVDLGIGKAEAFREQWQRQLPDIPLVVLDSPYRSLIDPVLEFVKTFEVEHKKDREKFCTVVLPVFVTRHRWENLLHNQSTIALRSALRAQGTRVVTTVGFYL